MVQRLCFNRCRRFAGTGSFTGSGGPSDELTDDLFLRMVLVPISLAKKDFFKVVIQEERLQRLQLLLQNLKALSK